MRNEEKCQKNPSQVRFRLLFSYGADAASSQHFQKLTCYWQRLEQDQWDPSQASRSLVLTLPLVGLYRPTGPCVSWLPTTKKRW